MTLASAAPVPVPGRPARLLLVHAHPDDETLATGVTIAHHVAAGDEVHVLTCTLGEEGEVIPDELAHLAADREDRLDAHRREELRGAMASIGARSHVLREGSPERWRDSGMAGSPSAEHPRAWAAAPLEEAAAAVREVIQQVDPDLVITYDQQGGYAHPDHIRTHEATCAALAAMPAAARPALFGIYTPRSWATQDRDWLAAHPVPGWTQPEGPYPPSVVDDAVVTHAVVDPDAVAAQAAALEHHRTQVTVAGETYALSNDVAARLSGREGFARLDPGTGQPLAGDQPAETGDGSDGLSRGPAERGQERPPLVGRTATAGSPESSG